MATLNAPPNFVQDKVSTLFSGKDVHDIVDKYKRLAIEATAVIKEAQEWADVVGLHEPHRIKIVGTLMVRLIMFIHKKNSKSRKEYKSIGEIVRDFVADVEKATAAKLSKKHPLWRYTKGVDCNSQPAASGTQGPDMRTFEQGDLMALPKKVHPWRHCWKRIWGEVRAAEHW